MKPLRSEARSFVDAARGHEDPTDEDRARIRKALLLRIGGAAVATTAATSTAAASTAASVAGSGVWAKIVVTVTVVALGGTGAAILEASHAPPPSAARSVAPMVVAAESKAERFATQDAPVSPVQAEGSPPDSAAVTNAASARPSAPRTVAKGDGSAPARSAAPGLEAEIDLLGDAQRELATGNPDRALQLLDDHERAFTSGALREERTAARVFALCKAGRVAEARALAAHFLVEAPRSPLAGRVRAACVEK